MAIRQSARQRLARFEQEIPFMYIDSTGNVTVGIGHLLAQAVDAGRLPFLRVRQIRAVPPGQVMCKKIWTPPPPVNASSDQPLFRLGLVDSTEIEEEFHFLSQYYSILCRYKGKAQRRFTSLEITPQTMRGLFEQDIARTLRGLKTIKEFRDFDRFPAPAQEGLLDMAFNMGVEKLRYGWHHFKAAVARRDWVAASRNCHRVTPGLEDRNRAVAQDFMEAAAWDGKLDFVGRGVVV